MEHAISEWRKQMLAAGIKSPVPLEELESHLREEVERQMKSGMNAQQAFEITVSQIGRAKELKTEFAKDRSWLFWLGRDTFTKINRVLGTLWLVFSFLGIVLIGRDIFFHISRHGWDMGILMALLLWVTYATGILGSILLIRGTNLGRWIIGSIAGLFVLISLFVLIVALIGLRPTRDPFLVVKVGAFTTFYAITVWRMFLSPRTNIKIPGK